MNLSDTFEHQGIHSSMLDVLLRTLSQQRTDYAAIDNRNILVRSIASHMYREMDEQHREQVMSVFSSAGPTHDALQEFLDAWIDWVDTSEQCHSGSCACYEEDSTGWCRLDYID